MWKEPNFYFTIAVAVMVILFISSSQTYEQQITSRFLLSRRIKEEPLKEWLSKFAFSYAGSEISIAEKRLFFFCGIFYS